MELLERKNDIPVIKDDKENHFKQHQLWEEQGIALNICEARIRDLLPIQFIEVLRNQLTTLPAYNKKVNLQKVDTDGDFDIIHQRYEMPFMIYNRSFFNTYYNIEGCEPGEYQFIVSGVGNEEFAKKHAKKCGRDVVGVVLINFIGVRPIKNSSGDIIGTFL